MIGFDHAQASGAVKDCSHILKVASIILLLQAIGFDQTAKGAMLPHEPSTNSDNLSAILINPTKKEEPENRWITTVWSIDAKNVHVVEKGRSPVFNESVALTIATSGNITDINLDTTNLELQNTPLVTVVRKFIYSPAAQPWKSAGGLFFHVPVAVQNESSEGSAVVYLSASLILTDRTSGNSFWLMVSLYDPRGRANSADNVQWKKKSTDEIQCSPTHGTKLPIVGTLLNEEARFVRILPGSLPFESTPFALGRFEFKVGNAELSAILQGLARNDDWCTSGHTFSRNVEDYDLQQIALMFEGHVGKRKPSAPSPDQWVKAEVKLGTPVAEIKQGTPGSN